MRIGATAALTGLLLSSTAVRADWENPSERYAKAYEQFTESGVHDRWTARRWDPDFSPPLYRDALKANMLAMKSAFPRSTTMQYANFMPGEWLPWEDEGYLRALYAWGEEIGVGLGAPDLMVRRKGQLNHALALMHERENQVPLLHAFARDFLKVNYIFWVDQAPYFEEDLLSCL